MGEFSNPGSFLFSGSYPDLGLPHLDPLLASIGIRECFSIVIFGACACCFPQRIFKLQFHLCFLDTGEHGYARTWAESSPMSLGSQSKHVQHSSSSMKRPVSLPQRLWMCPNRPICARRFNWQPSMEMSSGSSLGEFDEGQKGVRGEIRSLGASPNRQRTWPVSSGSACRKYWTLTPGILLSTR